MSVSFVRRISATRLTPRRPRARINGGSERTRAYRARTPSRSAVERLRWPQLRRASVVEIWHRQPQSLALELFGQYLVLRTQVFDRFLLAPIDPSRQVSSMNCHGFSTCVTFALLHRTAVDDPISGRDGVLLSGRTTSVQLPVNGLERKRCGTAVHSGPSSSRVMSIMSQLRTEKSQMSPHTARLPRSARARGAKPPVAQLLAYRD
jgi:hypothetical protein